MAICFGRLCRSWNEAKVKLCSSFITTNEFSLENNYFADGVKKVTVNSFKKSVLSVLDFEKSYSVTALVNVVGQSQASTR